VITINNKNNDREEIKMITTAGTNANYGLTSTLKLKQVSIESKIITLYAVVIRPVILYACETRPTTKGDEMK